MSQFLNHKEIRFSQRQTRCEGRERARCCPKEPQQKVTRSIYETSREVTRVLAQTKQ
jgi:hypothetical protein